MVLAQVITMAVCGIHAVALTKEETTQTLFNNEHGMASMSYELLGEDQIKWTLDVQKVAHDSPTRFMVEILAGGTAVALNNIVTSNPAISLMSGNGDGYILAGLSEAATGSPDGSAVVTFETSRDISQLTATPKMIMDVAVPVEPVAFAAVATETPEESDGEATEKSQEDLQEELQVVTQPTNLLEGSASIAFNIPPVVEEVEPVTPEEPIDDAGEEDLGVDENAPIEGEPVVDEVTPVEEVPGTVDDEVVAEEVPGTVDETLTDEESDVAENPTVDVEISDGNDDSTGSIENEVAGEVEQSDDADVSEAEGETIRRANLLNSQVAPLAVVTDITSLRLEKEWILPEGSLASELPSIFIQVMQGDEVYKTEEISCPKEADSNGKYITIREWKNLPIVKDASDNILEYSIREVDSLYYEEGTPVITESSINEMYMESSCSSTDWKVVPTFTIARSTGGKAYFIWTLNHLEVADRDEFLTAVLGYGSVVGNPINGDLNDIKNGTFSGTVLWNEGPYVRDEFDKGPVSVDVSFNDDNTIEGATLTFGGSNVWTHFVTGGYSTRKSSIVNTYIPQNKITVQKTWDDAGFGATTREDIQLQLQQKIGNEGWKDVEGKTYDILKSDLRNEISSNVFTVPSKVNGQNAVYRVIEKVKVGTSYTGDRVYGYASPTPNDPQAGDYTVTNTLLKTDFGFTKVDSQGNPLVGVTFDLSRDGMEEDPWAPVTTVEGGKVNFSGLPVGHYTLTETDTAPGYVMPESPNDSWGFTVKDTNGTEAGMQIVWDEGENPFEDKTVNNNGNIVNELKPFDLTVNKVNDQNGKLEGATFELSGGDLAKPLEVAGGPEFKFAGLKPGTYTLTETKAPPGYAKLLNPITIVINVDGTVDVSGEGATKDSSDNKVEDGNNTISITVKNNPLTPLPATGGSGTMTFVIGGSLALLTTGLYFLRRKDQEVA